jgi:hypothetical protein
LEGSNLVSSPKKVISPEVGIRRRRGRPRKRPRYEEKGISITSGQYCDVPSKELCSKDSDFMVCIIASSKSIENKRQRADFVVQELLKRKLCGESYKDAYAGWTETTLKNYKGGLSSFVSFLEEEEIIWDDFYSPQGIQHIFDEFSAWLRDNASSPKRFPYSSVSIYKSAVSSLINAAFNLKVSESYANKLCMKGFKLAHRKAPIYKDMWSIEVMLSYYRTPPLICDNEEEQFTFLQTKTAALIMFSAFLRIRETTIISLEGMKVGKECIWVHTILKSKQDFLTPIASPFFDENQAICPASTVLNLIQANNIHFGKTSSLFFD